MPFFALTIFTGAFLLFQVQPLMGKYLLPWFGGGPGVWTTCLLFFQVLLLGGYAYAHGSARWLKPRAQVGVHLLLLLGALMVLPITPVDTWKPSGQEHPTLKILWLLTVCLGLPYFVLSSTGPLMQHWFSRAHPGRSPYRLYALSNAGSLLALVSYPFFLEAHFTRRTQATGWAWGFGAYALVTMVCAVKQWRGQSAADDPVNPGNDGHEVLPPRPSAGTRLLWLLLPACASGLLLATTNKMCQDVAAVPFLWVLPLALYLLSFILCFDHPRWYGRAVFTPALGIALAAVSWVLFAGVEAPLRAQLIVYAAALFVGCMVCHGELYRLRPAPPHLTAFYLTIAAGGAVGGGFVAVLAPMVFTDYYELHWGWVLCAGLLLVVCWRDHIRSDAKTWRTQACGLTGLALLGLDRALAWVGAHSVVLPSGGWLGLRIGLGALVVWLAAGWVGRGKFQRFRFWREWTVAGLGIGLLVLAGALWTHARQAEANVVARVRNFYGILKLCEYHPDDPANHYLLLQHGRITHGIQFTDPTAARWPASYYAEGSGVALAVDALPSGPRRMGVLGLGVGTMAAWGRSGDTVRFYEINPRVHELAATRFTYLRDSPARVEVVMGDARLSLESEPPQAFDLLVLDAFSSDAVPVHLLTREAFAVYARHVQPDGILAVHISNRYLDLTPVVAAAARHFNYQLALIHLDESDDDDEEAADPPWWVYSSSWILLTRNPDRFESPAIREAASEVNTNSARVRLWTDDFASVFQILQ